MQSQIRVTILPFLNISSVAENDYLCDGITEEIISALSKTKGIRITSRTSAFKYKGSDKSIKDIGSELSVDLIVEGSVSFINNVLKINVRLIEVSSDEAIWSQSWNGNLRDIFDLQDKISVEIADTLREDVGHLEFHNPLVKPQTENIEAYKNYLKGNYYFLKWNKEDVDRAIDFYNKALELDENHAESYYGLCQCHTFLAGMGYSDPNIHLQKAQYYAEKTIKLNDQLPEAYFGLASISFWNQWDLPNAIKNINKALSLNVNLAGAYQLSAKVNTLTGNYTKALRDMDIAIKLDPLSANKMFSKSLIYYINKDYHQALVFANEAISRDERLVPAYVIKGCVFLKTKKYQSVLSLFNTSEMPFIDELTKFGLVGIAYFLMGEKAKANELYARISAMHSQDNNGRALAFSILFCAATGNYNEAIKLLRKGIQIKLPITHFLIKDPLLENLNAEKEFTDLIKPLLVANENIGRIKGTTSKPLVDDITAKNWETKIRAMMEDDMAFLSPDLTLRKLARHLDIHPNQLSYVLNNYFHKNFSEFVNKYRLNYFLQLLNEGQHTSETLLGLAYDSGFNSKTAFYNYFKKDQGITPKQFLARNK